MKKIMLHFVTNFILLITAFCQSDMYDSIYVGNVWRSYNIHLPTSYNSSTNYPLIVGFHGGQQAATSAQGWTVFAYQSNLSEKADSSGFIVVYPEGRVFNQNRSWNAGDCCPPAMNQDVDDVGFIDNLLDSLFANYPIDTTRVYAAGSSNGGMLCYRLACELSHRFAAIATNACSQMYFPCHPINKIPIISFHSKVDPIVFYNGVMGGVPPLTTFYFPSQDSTLHLWSQNYHCQSRDTIINGSGTDYDFIKIHNCSCNVEMHHYATTDGSHSWPGGNPNNNPVSTQISATDLLWSFFQNYYLGCEANEIQENRELDWKIMPNPCSDFVTISTCARGLGNFKIYNHLGQWIKEVDSNESVWTFSTTNWAPGVYYIFSVDKESWIRFIKM